MQRFIDTRCDLLDEKGHLTNPGYSTTEIWDYERADIRASTLRIKEWDYYYVGNESFGVALTIADNSYMGLISASLLDFTDGFQETKSKILPFTFGRLALPPSADVGETVYKNDKIEMHFRVKEKERHIRCHYHDFSDGMPLIVDVKLTDAPQDRICIATPFAGKKTHFYFNQKINCMHAEGYVQMGERSYVLGASPKDMGLLDWGRGVWTYKNTWYWSSLSTEQDGVPIGFKLGYGFGNNDQASENMLFVGKEVYKLNDVKMDIPLNRVGGPNFMEPWTFRSSDGCIDMRFTPILDRKSDTNLLILRSNQHQVFGYFDGVIKADGKEFPINHKLGFAEKVYNRW